MFSSAFLLFIVVASLVWTAFGALALILLLVRDWKNEELW